MAQLGAQVATTGAPPPDEPLPAPDRLHWVGTGPLARAFVEGDAVQALCGVWFVPVTDDSAALPVCPKCEHAKPYAQELLDALRASRG